VRGSTAGAAPNTPFIAKPFDVGELARRVRQVLDRRSPFSGPPRP